MDYTQQLTAEEAAALRTEMIAAFIDPSVRGVFRRVPEVQSAVLLVSQMWCDEATDAVHEALRFSQETDPDLKAFMEWSRSIEWEDDSTFEDSRGLEFLVDRDEPLSAEVLERIERALEDEDSWLRWDSNVAAIPAFAAFCEEDCHQEMPPGRAESPHAIFRRSGTAIEMEVVGTMTRPDRTACRQMLHWNWPISRRFRNRLESGSFSDYEDGESAAILLCPRRPRWLDADHGDERFDVREVYEHPVTALVAHSVWVHRCAAGESVGGQREVRGSPSDLWRLSGPQSRSRLARLVGPCFARGSR